MYNNSTAYWGWKWELGAPTSVCAWNRMPFPGFNGICVNLHDVTEKLMGWNTYKKYDEYNQNLIVFSVIAVLLGINVNNLFFEEWWRLCIFVIGRKIVKNCRDDIYIWKRWLQV